MRRFNPDRELKKIQHGSRNKVIFSILFGIILLTIGYSFALYQVRYSKRIIYTKVSPFSNKDIQLAVYLDGELQTSVPKKGTAYYDSVECDNDLDATAKWDYDKWKLKEFEASVPNKCNINFTENYRDRSGANYPKLFQGLIPVTLSDGGGIKVADLTKKWYDYDAKEWANAILVNYSDAEIKAKYFTDDGMLRTDIYDQEVVLSDILQMYVWIPRYKYQLFNVSNESVNPQEIQIEFEPNTKSSGNTTCTISDKGVESCTNAKNGNWYTHPAFTFGNTDLTGIWVGKFETSGNDNVLTIKPNISSWREIDIKTMFNASRNIEETNSTNFNLNKDEIDTHMMKNMEWGAMAYLTHSKYGRCNDQGKCSEVAINGGYITGYNGTANTWDTTTGQLASTTGNIYGIYDTNGDTWEYVMGVIIDTATSDIYYSDSGFDASTMPKSKYYELYEYDTVETTHQRGHLGDATRETLKTFRNNVGGWYDDFAYFPYSNTSWFHRGGGYGDGIHAGTFAFSRWNGEPLISTSFRVVLTAEDDNNPTS